MKQKYRKWIRIGLIISLLLHIFLMQGYKKIKARTIKRTVAIEALQVEEIPQTQQERQRAAPSRPTVPIVDESETLPEDETIEFTDLDLYAEPPPPPPPPSSDEENIFAFVPHDEAPLPIGGYEAIHKNLKYPDFARKAGLEGKVEIYAEILTDGTVGRTRIMKQLTGCDEAAVNAIKSVQWKPAMQRDRPVKVWIMVPVEFRLK